MWTKLPTIIAISLSLSVLVGCNNEEPAPITCSGDVTPIGENFFADISDSSGIRGENFDPAPAITITINDHSAVGFVDINGDGYDDIIAHNLWPNIAPDWNGQKPLEHLVFRNNGDKTFTNVTDLSGLRDVDAAFFAYGDIDNDGDTDIFAGFPLQTVGHRNSVWLNDGKGVFVQKAGSSPGSGAYAASGILADFDGDAVLDLFIGNGHTLAAVPDDFYLGNGDGTFTNANGRLLGLSASITDGSVACDYDNDNDLDIFVSTYGVSYENGHNILWENDGQGNFTNVAEARGFAYQKTGNYYLETTGYGEDDEQPASGSYVGSNGFGIDCADVNNDGFLDVVVSAISHPDSNNLSTKWSDPTVLLINQGPNGNFGFINQFLERGLIFNEGDSDASFADFDNDGRLDIALSRSKKYEGHYSKNENKGYFGLFHQLYNAFESVGLISGINDPDDTVLCRMGDAQSHAWADIDLDGDLDLLAGGRNDECPGLVGRPNFLFENLIGSKNPWVAYKLRGDGVHVPRDATGARVVLTFDDGEEILTREVKTNQGNWNPSDTRTLYFGLGARDICGAKGEVTWPDGTRVKLSAAALKPRKIHELRY
ncbi:MAG: hypothetical protein A2289_05680 [Deltaproteobacteria bacterium RIFOXYA12_FULL_58_15]|nr:MAG: hypothetical protein A2289_05680 [Deltaproteobacteria bacterium RIFOXYA12_FULL_58_15]